jgi:ubiquinone/menaquinone biosynthesis C-methylase UbiE
MSLGVWFAHLPRQLANRLYPVLRYTNLMRAVEMRHLAPWVRDVRGWQVLDVGCGYGFYSLDFARRGAGLVGCDLSLEALKASHETVQGLGLNGRAAYMVANGSVLPLPCEAFDLVFCNCVLEHVANDRQALAEMHRTLRPGGLLYLTVDNAEHNLTLGFLERLSPGAKKRLLRPEVADAPTVAQGLDDYLAGIYDVRRRYRRDELEATLEDLGFEVLARRAYVSLLGAAHYEIFRLTRGVDPRRGLSRLAHMLTSLVFYPFIVFADSFQRQHGYGLMFVARK